MSSETSTMARRRERLIGVLLGTAVGDAIGLPREGLSPRRAARFFGARPMGYSLFFGRGLWSDDTEHTILSAEALLESGGAPERFASAFARRLRWWLARCPAGIGWATLRATTKLWFGVPPERSGVFSAGNGPAMRAAILGVYAGNDMDRLKALVRASSRITHTDPRAEAGAQSIALAAQWAATDPDLTDPQRCLDVLCEHVQNVDLQSVFDAVRSGLNSNFDPPAFANERKFERSGPSGFMPQTIAAALFCWLRSPRDFRSAVESAVLLGGDADTVGAIVGALSGATLGPAAIPTDWIDGLVEWPISVEDLRELGARLGDAQTAQPAGSRPLVGSMLLIRNFFFAAIVMGHGFRRLLPPY